MGLPDGYPVAAYSGALGAELLRAKANGWDVAFAQAEHDHGLPAGILPAVASRETNMTDEIGDDGHGRGLMQIDDRSGGRIAWLSAHGADSNGGKPDVPAAIDFGANLIEKSLSSGRAHGISGDALLKYALSAYNAGDGGSMSGHMAGDSDLHTTGHNYGADVMRRWHTMYPGADGSVPGSLSGGMFWAVLAVAGLVYLWD